MHQSPSARHAEAAFGSAEGTGRARTADPSVWTRERDALRPSPGGSRRRGSSWSASASMGGGGSGKQQQQSVPSQRDIKVTGAGSLRANGTYRFWRQAPGIEMVPVYSNAGSDCKITLGRVKGKRAWLLGNRLPVAQYFCYAAAAAGSPENRGGKVHPVPPSNAQWHVANGQPPAPAVQVVEGGQRKLAQG